MGYGSSNGPSGPLICPRCGKDNFAFASFCHTCGEPLDQGDSDLPSSSDSAATSKENRADWAASPERAFTYTARKLWRWESLLGVALLAITLGYALVTWRTDTAHADAYHRGLAAEERKDWDEAAADFDQAGGLRDSLTKRNQARSNIVLRNNMYQRGITATGQQNWPAAISAFERVQEIQPDYRDTAVRLKTSRSEAFRSGLSGLIYLVSDGNSPGLYLRDSKGKIILLPGSDKHSIVHAISPDSNMFVYDRPSTQAEYGGAGTEHNPIVPDPFGTGASSRVAMFAKLSDDGTLTTFPLPKLDPTGQGVFSSSGLWWYSLQLGGELFGYEVFYAADLLANGSNAQIMRVSDIQRNKGVVAVDPPRSKVIIAVTEGQQRDGNRETYLYLAGATGDIDRLVHKADGDVVQASVSADGTRLLYITQQDIGDTISRTVWVAPLDGGFVGTGSQWQMQLDLLSWSGLKIDSHLTASFLPQPDISKLPKVIVDKVESGIETVTVYDLGHFSSARIWQAPADGILSRSMSGFSSDGDMMASRSQPDNTATLGILGLGAQTGLLSNVDFRSTPDQIVRVQFSPNDNYVIASVQNPEGISRGVSQEVYSLHVSSDGQVDSDGPKRIAYANYPYEDQFSPVAMPEAGFLLAYVQPSGELHAAFYDGSSDTKIADGVAAVWSLDSRTDLSWWK